MMLRCWFSDEASPSDTDMMLEVDSRLKKMGYIRSAEETAKLRDPNQIVYISNYGASDHYLQKRAVITMTNGHLYPTDSIIFSSTYYPTLAIPPHDGDPIRYEPEEKTVQSFLEERTACRLLAGIMTRLGGLRQLAV